MKIPSFNDIVQFELRKRSNLYPLQIFPHRIIFYINNTRFYLLSNIWKKIHAWPPAACIKYIYMKEIFFKKYVDHWYVKKLLWKTCDVLYCTNDWQKCIWLKKKEKKIKAKCRRKTFLRAWMMISRSPGWLKKETLERNISETERARSY